MLPVKSVRDNSFNSTKVDEVRRCMSLLNFESKYFCEHNTAKSYTVFRKQVKAQFVQNFS